MYRIILNKNRGFAWIENKRICVRGYFYGPDGAYYEGERLAEYFGSATTFEKLRALVEQANGYFSVILKQEEVLWLATDMIRSLPLFYAKKEGEWLVADEASAIDEALDSRSVNDEALLEFRGTGYVTGSETLITGIQQVRAGEILELGKEPHRSHWHTYRVSVTNKSPYNTLREEGKGVFERTFSRMVGSLRGQTAVVPLSGGYDSRLIAVMLKRAGYTDVICFSYGRKDNPEAVISKKVAEKLGFPWIFIEYTDELIDHYLADAEFRSYFRFASNYSSMFFMQEYFAVRELKRKNLIPDDALFVPGHSGDFIGGSQFAKHGFSAEKEPAGRIVSRIFEIKYHYGNYSRKQALLLKKRIGRMIAEKDTGKEALAYSVHEDWDLKEKFARFNVNSNATYLFFGYAFRMPYWDHEPVNFFRQLPVKFKMNKRLYDDLLVNEFFKPYDVNFESELQYSPGAYSWGRFKKRVKKFLPQWFINLFTKKEDLLCYREITGKMKADLAERGIMPGAHGNRYNKVIIEWYIHWFRENLNR